MLHKKLAEKTLSIIAKTINGTIQEFPPIYKFPCSQVQPAGEAVIRDYDENFCIVAKKVFLIVYNQNVFGTTQFTTDSEFWQYQRAACACCGGECSVNYNNCNLEYNECVLILN